MKINSNGQWSLFGNEDSLLFKTSEKRQAGKNKVIKRKKVDPNSKEGEAIFSEFAKSIVRDTPKQPTDEEMFGHLVVSEEQIEKAEEDWNNTLNKHFDGQKTPVEDQDSAENRNWGNGKSFNESLEEEELQKRNIYIG